MADGPKPASTVKAIVLSYGPDREAAGLIDALCDGGDFTPAMVLETHNPASPGEVVAGDRGQTVINLTANIGYAGAMNVGIRRLLHEADYLLLLTHDVRITAAAVRQLVDALDADESLAAVGPVLTQHGEVWSAGKSRGRSWQFSHIAQRPRSSVVRVDSLDGSAMLIRVRDLPAELMNEGFFMYFEETELLERIARTRGRGVAVVSAATAESAPGWASRPQSHAYLMLRNGLCVAHRYGGFRASWAYALVWAGRMAIDIVRGAGEGGDVPDARDARGTGTPAARRLLAVRTAIAGCVGIMHFLLHRMGPPPAWLQDGDLQVTAQP